MADNRPDFRWVAFYYPEILAGLIELKRTTWPEHTEEDPHDPVIQLYRAFAVVAHLQAVRLDHAAREVYLPTARLRSSFIALARLVDYELATAVPAETHLVATVSGSLSGFTRLVRAHSTFATEGDADSPAVAFEYDEDDDLYGGPTGTAALRVLEDDGGTVTEITSSLPLALWGGGNAAENDAIYFGGDEVLAPNKIELEITGAAGNTWYRWEYRDDRDGEPDSVVDNGGTITLGVDSVIGADADSPNGGEATGLEVVVTCLRTGVSETCNVDSGGPPNTITTTGNLGQTSVSTNPADYLIETEWVELPGLDDETTSLTVVDTGIVSFTLPHDTTHRWLPSDPLGEGVDSYWWRARCARAGTASGPTLASVSEARKTTWAVTWEVRQGQRVTVKLGTSDGTADQTFTLTRTPFLELVEVTVDGDAWTEVDNFLASAAYDRHFTLTEDPDGSWIVTFGDGTNGKIPSSSAAVVSVYRIGGDNSGNVGADTITRDRTGNPKIRAITNPQAATGWEVQEGTTDDSLDDLRVEIPASLRTRSRAVTPEDCEDLVVEFTTEDGSAPVVRALAIEEGNGPKTLALVCVGPGGTAPIQADLDEVDAYFNGETVGLQRVGGLLIANTELTAEAFTPYPVDVTVTVKVLADYATGADAKIEAALGAILTPTATRQLQDSNGDWYDSGDYLWSWEGEVDPSVLLGAIYTSTPGIVGITMSAPAAPYTLAAGELPTAGTLAVTVTSV